ncbi:MAG: TetR/AcrR family transcriptional regulator [Myxococcota bacterium]
MGRRKGPSLTKQQVVDASVQIVRTEGADALGVSRVARELGIRPPSLYNHVESGDDLCRAVVAAATHELVETFKGKLRGIVEPREQLRTLAYAVRDWARENGGLYALMARVEPEPDHPDVVAINQDLLDMFARPLGQLGVPPEHRVHAIRGLRAAIHGFVLLESGGQFQMKEDPEVSFGWMVRALIQGLEEPV